MKRNHHRLLEEVFSCCLGVRGSLRDPSVDTGIQRCLPPTIQLSRGCSDRWCPRSHTQKQPNTHTHTHKHTHTHTRKPFSYKGCRKYPRHLGMFIFVFRLVSLHFYRGSISQMPMRDEPPNREPCMLSFSHGTAAAVWSVNWHHRSGLACEFGTAISRLA